MINKIPDGISRRKSILLRSYRRCSSRHRHHDQLCPQRQSHRHEWHDLRHPHSPQGYHMHYVEDIHEKLSIIGGMLIASGIFFDIFGYETSNKFTPFGPAEHITSQTSYIGYALAGLLVGFGTKLSNGCTSGHGLCGLPRFSIRSFVAVCVFLCTAIGISTLRYYVTLGPFTS